MTIYFPNSSIIIRRERNLSGLKYGFSATYTVYAADIQPLEETRTNLLNGRIGKTYEAYIDASIDVKEGDQISTGGRIYSVQAVSTFSGASLLDHKSLILVMQD